MTASAASAVEERCRTCGGPRGETVGLGTRCGRCTRNHALGAWVALSVGAEIWAVTMFDVDRPGQVGLVTFLALPLVTTAAVLAHELAHALAGAALSVTVTRIEIGEGRRLVRLGRRPELLFGTVPGSGWVRAAYYGRDGYRWRVVAFLLAAPPVSGALAVAAVYVSAGWPLWARTVAVVFAALNVVLLVISLIPVPTFGRRVWSDLSSALSVARMTDAELDLDRVGRVAEHMHILSEGGRPEEALGLAHRFRATFPEVPGGWSLVVFGLASAGRTEEAEVVARDVLAREPLDDATRAYLGPLASGGISAHATPD